MTIQQLQQLAFDFGFSATHISETQLIRNIQIQRGEEPCYMSDKRYGCTTQCEWRHECCKLKAQWRR
jgi:hypothetical protein